MGITQILESEECMKSIQTFEETGNADKVITTIEAQEKPKTAKSTSSSNIRTRSGNTYFSLDSKSWQAQVILMFAAILFIVIGTSLKYSLLAIPITLVTLYIGIYLGHWVKANKTHTDLLD